MRTRLQIGAALIAWLGAGACGPDEVTLTPGTVRLHLTGTVTSRATGAPIPGARVDLTRTFIGSGYTVETVVPDAQGAYAVRFDAVCPSASDDHGYILVARAPGHEELSDINISRRAVCTTAPQRMDFALRPIVAPPGLP